MAFTLDISIGLGRGSTGLILNARLVDSDNNNVTSAISSGFEEIGTGFYLFHYESYPDNFRGGVKFFEEGIEGTVLAFAALNPEEMDPTRDRQLEVNVGHSQDQYHTANVADERTGRNIEIQTGSISGAPIYTIDQ